MRAVRLLPLHLDLFRPAPEAVGLAAPTSWCRRSPGWSARRWRAPHRAIRWRRGGRRAAIDDQPVAADRQLERQRAGMGEAVEPGRRRRAAIDDQHGAAGLQALKAAVGQGGRARARRVRPGSAPARSAAACSSLLPLNSARPPSPWRSARSAGAIRSIAAPSAAGRLRLRGLQQRADFDQVLQRREVGGRAALDMAAVRQHLAADLLRQEAQRAGQERRMVRQRDGGGDQALERRQRAARPAPRPAGRPTARARRRPAAPSASGGTRRRREAAKKS